MWIVDLELGFHGLAADSHNFNLNGNLIIICQEN